MAHAVLGLVAQHLYFLFIQQFALREPLDVLVEVAQFLPGQSVHQFEFKNNYNPLQVDSLHISQLT